MHKNLFWYISRKIGKNFQIEKFKNLKHNLCEEKYLPKVSWKCIVCLKIIFIWKNRLAALVGILCLIDHVERSFIISWGSTINITNSVNKFMVSVRFFTDSPLVSNSIFLSFQLKYSSYKNSGLCYRKRFWIRRFEYFFVMFPCSGSKLLNKIFFGTISIFTYTHWYTNVTVSLST